MVNHSFHPQAAVVRDKTTWFSLNGYRPEFHATPDWATIQLDRVVLAAQTLWFRHRREGTVLWQCTMQPAELKKRLHHMLGVLRSRDCHVTETGMQTGWFTIRHDGFPDVHLGIGPLIAQGRMTIGRLDDHPEVLACRLSRYADMTGAAWRGTAGLSGTASIRTLHESTRGASPLWKWKKPDNVPGMIGCSFELSPRKHSRPLMDHERRMRYVHHFDIRAAYLAACGVANLGWSAPVHSGPREFDPGRAGYWQVRRDEVNAMILAGPSLYVPRNVIYRDGTSPLMWLSTPVVAWLAEHLAWTPEVFDSWTADRSGRYLREWSSWLSTARRTLRPDHVIDSGVLDAVKDTYARTVGMFNRETSRVFRPDWWDIGRDTSRINGVRKIQRAKLVPCRFNVDSIWVATDDDAHDTGVRLGVKYDDQGREIDQVGKFKHIRTYTVEEYLAEHELAA